MTSTTPAPTVHKPVLLDAVSAYLPENLAGLRIVDCTLGGGGYTRALLQRGATVLACDKDTLAITRAQNGLQQEFPQLKLFHGSFAEVETALAENGWESADVIVADLGLSSDQLDTPERGFSFHADGPLDMRMGQDSYIGQKGGKTAADILNIWDEQQLFVMFKKYGDEPKARPLAKRIVSQRKAEPFTTTQSFLDVIEEIYPPHAGLKRRHPAQRLFQALRMAVNEEENDLETLLKVAPQCLSAGGKLMIVTFHSLEDRLVKQAFRAACASTEDYLGRTIGTSEFSQPVRKVVPTVEETEANPRARSATLRILQRAGGQN